MFTRMNTNTPYNDKNEMIEKITSILPTMDVEDIQYIYDMMFEEED